MNPADAKIGELEERLLEKDEQILWFKKEVAELREKNDKLKVSMNGAMAELNEHLGWNMT